MNYCNQRLCVAKELIHLLCDNEDEFVNNSSAFERVVESFMIEDFEFCDGDRAAKREHAASMIAIELVMPTSLIAHAVEIHRATEGVMPQAIDMARMFRVPEAYCIGRFHEKVDTFWSNALGVPRISYLFA
jgi:Zn-dependent peptidase ImmA (M78 family)